MTYLLGLSLLLQLFAAALALRLAFVTGRGRAWLLISAALGLMALRRGVTFISVLRGEIDPDPRTEPIAIAISALMALGVAVLTPVLRTARRHDEIVSQLLESAPDAM